jgi:hypothetical protein
MPTGEVLTALAIGLVVGAFGAVVVVFAFLERAVHRRRNRQGPVTR